jgi:glycosyltransferase involved in cell wall biosynthesis
MSPLVSTVIIFLDAARFLDEAIRSVFAQTYSDWELLLVDDGSRDGGSAIARGYANRFPERVRYLEHHGHENLGMSASRNLGVRRARGEYVAFLDADDVWLPHKLEEQVAVMEREPEAGMVYGRTLIWNGWTGDVADEKRDETLDLGVPPDSLVRPPALLLLLLENRVQTPTTCNALFRRSVFDRVGGFEESFRGLYEDQVFFTKVHASVPSYVSGSCWAKYRQHDGSCSATAREYFAGRLRFLKWAAGYLEQTCASEPVVRRALHAHIRRCRWGRLVGVMRG